MADQPSEREQQEILTRLRRVEGQIRGIQRMITEERDCEAIVTQLLAARAALDKASLYIMSRHIEHCLRDADSASEQARLDRVISFFLRFATPAISDMEMEPGPDEGDGTA